MYLPSSVEYRLNRQSNNFHTAVCMDIPKIFSFKILPKLKFLEGIVCSSLLSTNHSVFIYTATFDLVKAQSLLSSIRIDMNPYILPCS